MSYQVLARKWRPQIFADVVGQQHVLAALANGLSSGRIHHAYLFSGTRGVGKTSIARLLAKGLNCETGITAVPCRQCDNCREIEQGRFVDLLEIDAASRTKVEDTRDLLDNVQYAPVRGRFKIYLIDEVHMLSRHSFNALLKTLEEPPSHVKFLLATTDPQKLPATILSRCLQFHLKALDVEQIRSQLERVLHEEQIVCEPQALRLLARAADGSLRDALSLTDQAIASGDGQIDVRSVSAMLGTLDDSQALPLIEAMVAANGERTFALINEAASRGAQWDALLVAMLSVLHRIAMIQLSPVALTGTEMSAIELRMRELARTLSPTDLQLYYQTLLIGRKELPYAPDRRMGVEMTLLRALAFHPCTPAPDSRPPSVPAVSAQEITPAHTPLPSVSDPRRDVLLPDATSQVLAARDQLARDQRQRSQRAAESKKSEAARVRPVNPSALERLASVSGRVQARQGPSAPQQSGVKKEDYRWRASAASEELKVAVTTPGALKKALEHEKTPEMMAKLEQEVIERDPWAAEISQLKLPKLMEQLALNAWKEQNGSSICLHLRPAQRHLNSPDTQKVLAEAIGVLHGVPVELTIVEDDNLATRTPLEWRQAMYEEKLTQARESINQDNNIQTLRRFFDADLDEESIRPI